MLTLSFTLLNLIATSTYNQAAKEAVHLEAKYGIEAELILAIAKVESNFKVGAVGSSHGEIGLMQLRPTFFPKATFDVKNNMELAARHLSAIRPRCKAKYGQAWWVCYNIGQNRAATVKARSLPYYSKVMAAYGKEKHVKKTAENLRISLRLASGKGQSIIAQAP